MGLFGRTSCEEQRSYAVRVWTVETSDSFLVTEQLNKEEAEDFYIEFKKELESSKEWIEIEKNLGKDDEAITYLLNKKNIVGIALENRNN